MTEKEAAIAPIQDFEKDIQQLEDEVKELYKFRDLFFENHPMEMASQKTKLVTAKLASMSGKLDLLDESDVPLNLRAKYLYTKGRCYNVVPEYDPRALECFSKAVKLKPDMIEAWNELGECYWKNRNLKESQACLEGSLKRQRDPITLRSISILLRQQCVEKGPERRAIITRSVEYAREAVSMNPKDGISWAVLGNAYLGQYFVVAQLPATLKSAMTAYKQAWNDPIARGSSDLAFNKGVAHNYEECYEEAMECFEIAHRLSPSWTPPAQQMQHIVQYLQHVNEIVHTKGRVKTKRLQTMLLTMDNKMYGKYLPGNICMINKRQVTLQRLLVAHMLDGPNEGTVVMGRVVGSYLSENTVPFTFVIVDESDVCAAVNVYNMASGRGVLVGDCVCLPEPTGSTHVQKKKLPDMVELSKFINGNTKELKLQHTDDKVYNFRSIRINNPLFMLINGKRPSLNQYASTRVETTLESY